jgi:hypothetical protein
MGYSQGNKNSDEEQGLDVSTSAHPMLLRYWQGFLSIGSKTSKTPVKARNNQFKIQKLPLRLRFEVYFANAFDVLVATWRRERASGTLFHFAPLIFALGISVYFVAPFEPMLLALVITFAVFALASTVFVYHGTAWILICTIALFFGGMSAGKIRTDTIANHSLKARATG